MGAEVVALAALWIHTVYNIRSIIIQSIPDTQEIRKGKVNGGK